MIWEEIEFAKMKVTLEARSEIKETQFSSSEEELRQFDYVLNTYQDLRKVLNTITKRQISA